MASLVVVGLAVSFVGGCGGEDSGSDGRGATYTVGVDIPFHPLIDYVIARQDKYFDGKPYKVRFKVLDSSTVVPAFGRGDIDVIGTFPSLLPRIEQRYGFVAREFLPLARIKRGLGIWVPQGSPARKLADLKGAKVATPPIGQQWGEEEAMIFAATGVPIRKYFDVQESAAPVQQLVLGRAKAAVVGSEVVAQVAKAGKFRPVVESSEIFRKAYGDPFVLSGGLATRTDFLSKNRAFVRDLSSAFADAWQRYVANPQPVIAIAAKQSGVAPQQIQGFSEAIGLRDISPARRRIDRRDVATWTKIYGALARSGFLKRAPEDPSKYFLIGS